MQEALGIVKEDDQGTSKRSLHKASVSTLPSSSLSGTCFLSHNLPGAFSWMNSLPPSRKGNNRAEKTCTGLNGQAKHIPQIAVGMLTCRKAPLWSACFNYRKGENRSLKG